MSKQMQNSDDLLESSDASGADARANKGCFRDDKDVSHHQMASARRPVLLPTVTLIESFKGRAPCFWRGLLLVPEVTSSHKSHHHPA
jgi:hypothetical protein